MQMQKLEQQRINLVNRGVLLPEEKLFGSSAINYFERLVGKFGTWKQGGVAIFTDRHLILSKGLSSEYIHIPYDCMKKIETCKQGFFPMGLAITYENKENKEIITEKISLAKRKKWLELMSEQTGLLFL